MDVATLAELLHETAEQHDAYEKAAPPHDWWDWYAPYLDARQRGSTYEPPESGRRQLGPRTRQHARELMA